MPGAIAANLRLTLTAGGQILTELGVYLPSTGTLAYRPARGGNDALEQFGTPGFGNGILAFGQGPRAAEMPIGRLLG